MPNGKPMTETAHIALTEHKVRKALERVMDPEIPIVSVLDMGMITEVKIGSDNQVMVRMTPTFAGCPAIEVLKKSIHDTVMELGAKSVEVIVDYQTAWDSNRITEGGKLKLEKFGLGRPEYHEGDVTMEMVEHAKCPYCGSENTTLNSTFGSALCRSIHFCYDCSQTFERFKPV